MEVIDAQQIYEQFLLLEKEENLFQKLEINHIKIWHYIRVEVYNTLAESLGLFMNPNQGKVFYEEQKGLQNWIDENIIRSQFRTMQKDILIFNFSRRVKQENYYKCIYTDEWLKGLEKSFYVYERKYRNQIFFKPVKTKNLRYIDQEKYNKIFRKHYDGSIYRKESLKVAHCVINLLEKNFRILLQLKYKKKIVEVIAGCVAAREDYREYYKFLLKRIKPKIIIYVNGYSLDKMVLAELGKELNISTIEIEHGHIGSGHLAYNFKIKEKLKSFPDYLFVAGQHEVDAMRPPIPKENIFVVGSPELDIKVDYYTKIISQKKKKRQIITFISSGELDIANAAIELYQKLDKKIYKVYLKLHPGEYTSWREKYPGLENSGVHVVDDSHHNIYYYLAVSDYLIGIASTVLFEATRFNCNILILRKDRYFTSESLVQIGNGIYIDSMDEVVERITSGISKEKKDDYFYCRNSCQLIYNAIDLILEKQRKSTL